MAISMALAQVLVGECVARDEAGAWRALRAGDFLYQNDTVVSGENGRVDIVTVDGRGLSLWSNETLKMDAEVVGTSLPDAHEASIHAIDGNFIGMLVRHGIPADALPEPAADATEAMTAGVAFAQLLYLSESLGVGAGGMALGQALAQTADGAEARLDLRDLLPRHELASGDADKQSLAGGPRFDASGGGDEHALLRPDAGSTGQLLDHGAEQAAIVQLLIDHHKPVVD